MHRKYPVIARILTGKMIFKTTPRAPYKEVWRVQNEFGVGPYTDETESGTADLSWQEKPHSVQPWKTPIPQADKGFSPTDLETLEHGEQKFFGFETKAQLLAWFSPKELVRLADLGFHPTKVKARQVWSSGRQVMFTPF